MSIKTRLRAGVEWSMQNQRRFMLTALTALAAVAIVLSVGAGLWGQFGIGLILSGTGDATPRLGVTTAPPTKDPGAVRTGDPLGLPRGPLDGPATTTGTAGTATASLSSWAPLGAVDRTSARDVAGEFVRRWLSGAGHPQGDHDAWMERVGALASSGYRVNLSWTTLGSLPAAELTGTSQAATLGDQGNVTATLTTGQLLVVHLMRLADDDGTRVWVVTGMTGGPSAAATTAATDQGSDG